MPFTPAGRPKGSKNSPLNTRNLAKRMRDLDAELAQRVESSPHSKQSMSILLGWAWEVFFGQHGATLKDQQWAWERLMNRAHGREVDITVLGAMDPADNPLKSIDTERLLQVLKRPELQAPAPDEPGTEE